LQTCLAYLNLTKPRISLLFALTGLTSLLMEGSLIHTPAALWAVVGGIFLIGGAANTLNQYFERDIDKQMKRTASRRSLPRGLVTPRQALLFFAVSALVGSFLLFAYGGWLACLLGLATIGFYSFYYTLYLKPRTPYNIVIGGAAGAAAPLIGWAAASGTLSWEAWILFAIIFMWTPPHFWALALFYKQDYEKVSYPMLPVVAGDAETRKQILWYSYAMVPVTLVLALFPSVGWIYTGGALLLGVYFLYLAHKLHRTHSLDVSRRLFFYSIAYLFALFVLLMVRPMAVHFF
jgi:protoheme IX farnesyltransferase